MAIDLFRLNPLARTLQLVSVLPMDSLKFSEANDLEAWLSSCSARLFGREILWIARQDRATHDQRSDIVGVAKDGDLLIAELKKGLLEESAVTQALGYSAEYHEKTADDLENLFYTQSAKSGSAGLVVKADSLIDAKKRLADHLGPDVEMNETQAIILLGEQFSAKALAVCNYLNNAMNPEVCSFECWRYSIYVDGAEHFLAIEQLLPPPDARVIIEERREDSKSRKYARDPVRVAFMQAMVAGLANTEFKSERNRGQSYECRIMNAAWPKEEVVWFSVKDRHPAIWIPKSASYAEPGTLGLTLDSDSQEGNNLLIFNSLESGAAQYTEAIQAQISAALASIKFPENSQAPAI